MTNHAGPMSTLESIEILGQRLRGELNRGDLRKDLDIRGAFDEFRSWYWLTHLALDQIPEEIHEEEVGALEKFLPALAAEPIVKKIIESKKARGLWVPWTPPKRSEIQKRYPKARVWALWEARLLFQNQRMMDGSMLVAGGLEAADKQGRIINIRESPDFEPHPPWQPIMAQRYGTGKLAVPYPQGSGVEVKRIEDAADEKRFENQRFWYENTWRQFIAEMVTAILEQEKHPTRRLPTPPGPAADESIIRKARDLFIESNPALKAQRASQIERAKLGGGAEGESRVRERWLRA